MRVVNIHKRILDQPKSQVTELLKTLGTYDDKVWPLNAWPAMRFKAGFKVGSKGGHGPIRYTILKLKPGEYCEFGFTKPIGFNGTHSFTLTEINESQSLITHEIKMNTTFRASLSWLIFVRWLHDALIEDAFDNIENHFHKKDKRSSYNFWVKILRTIYK